MAKRISAQHGFTLVELLVVITILAILSSLLLPALSRGKETARQAICASNLRQLSIAARLYWDDHDDRTFRFRTYMTNNGTVYWFGWLGRGAEGTRSFDRTLGALAPYLAGRGVEVCPSLNYTMAKFKLKATGAAYGYGYNIHLSRPMGEPPFSVAAIQNPATVALFADAAQVNAFQPPASPDNPMLEEFYYISTNEPTTHFRHRSRVQAVFIDSHVESCRMAPGSIDGRLPSEKVGRLESELLDPKLF